MDNSLNCDIRPLALVVDDDPLVRIDLVDMLDDLGFNVVEADCVSAALAFLQTGGERVSFLLTDVQMPGSRNGVTLTNRVSFVWPHIRILVTSGVSQPAVGELPFQVQFIAKPVTPLALMAYVDKLTSPTPPT